MNREKEITMKFIIGIIVVSAVFCAFGALGGIVAAVLCIGGILFSEKGKTEVEKEPERVIESRLRLSDLRLPANLPFPYVVFGETGNILFYNGEFGSAFPSIVENKNIFDVLGSFKAEEGITDFKINDRLYNAYIKKSEVIDKNKLSDKITSMFFIDVTENDRLKAEIEKSRLVGAFIFIDNFEEVSEGLQETSIPILTALIDRKLNSFASETGSLLKRYEKDRYIFITTANALEKMKENKFEIINEIKTVSVGNHLPVTLSIGMSVTNDDVTIDNVLKDAKSAIDLALGRGGDQVVIKNKQGYQFFGGISGEVARNARIRARVKADAYAELIEGSDSVVVMGHKRPDLDCFGAAIGVMCIARSLNKPCYIVVDEVSPGIALLYDKFMSTGEYNSVIIKEAEALSIVKDTTLVTVVDTHRMSLVESDQTVKKAKKLVIFDHHRKSADYIEGAVLSYHEPYASSTCELVTEMMQYFEFNVKISNNEADALLSGITMDTKNFGLKTGAITFEAAAYLRRKGADSSRVRMLLRKDIASQKAEAEAVKSAFIYREGIIMSVCPGEEEWTTITAAQAADQLLGVLGIKAAFVFSKVKDTVFVSARSYGDVNVQVIAEKLGGGGHATIAGLQLADVEIGEAIEKVQAVIDEYLEV